MSNFIEYLLNAIAIGTTFLYGSVGEIITEKVGHLNLGIPGIMCAGGTAGCVALYLMYGSGIPAVLIVMIAIASAFIGAFAMGALYSFLTVTLRANQNVTGLAMTTFGVGLIQYVVSTLPGPEYLYAVKYFRYPFAKTTTALQYCGIMVFLAVIIAIVSSYVLTGTKVGLRLRAVGEDPATADAVGINVTAYRYIATCIGSGIAGLGGIFYIMDYSGSQEAYLSIEALGWLAIALVIFVLWRPNVSIFGSIVFGALFVAGTFIPSLGLVMDMSMTPILKMLPYVVTIIVLIITSVRGKKESQPPAALGLNYYREDR